MSESFVDEFSLSRAYNEAASMSVSCSGHPLSVLRPGLAAQGIVTARDLRHIPSGRRVMVTGILVIVHTPPTRSGKRVMFITMEDETGIIDLVLFPKAQTHAARPILTSEVVTVEGTLQRQGRKGFSISVVIEKVIAEWTGMLADFLKYQKNTPSEEGEPTITVTYPRTLAKGSVTHLKLRTTG
jgi:error-prone DNA polymerase